MGVLEILLAFGLVSVAIVMAGLAYDAWRWYK